MRVFLLIAICGTAFFSIKAAPHLSEASLRAVALGFACGLGQYLTIRLLAYATRLGPFSPIWCVLSLNFVPVMLYAATVQRVPQSSMAWLSVIAAFMCCILSAIGLPPVPHQKARTPVWGYGALLITMLLINAMPNVAIQDLNTAEAGTAREPFFWCMYASIAIASLIDTAAGRELLVTFRKGWLPGGMAAVGSVSGMLSLAAASARTGPTAFLVCSMVTLIIPMIAAVTVFNERPGLRWSGTLALGVLAIVLAYA